MIRKAAQLNIIVVLIDFNFFNHFHRGNGPAEDPLDVIATECQRLSRINIQGIDFYKTLKDQNIFRIEIRNILNFNRTLVIKLIMASSSAKGCFRNWYTT